MLSEEPFILEDPEHLVTGAVFNSPHSGRSYPDDLVEKSRLSAQGLRASEDVLVDELFSAAPLLGAPLLSAVAPRAWIDLNRSPSELDPALIDGIRPRGLNQRVAAGLGVIPRIVAEGTSIYDGKISLAEAENRIEAVHVPYHQVLSDLLVRAREQFGRAVLFDCHSMPTDALRAAPRVKGRLPEIVLGDRFGAAASRDLIAFTQAAFESAGFVVARNAPFAGGFITQRYGKPSKGFNAIQIEIDRGLYLDQPKLEPLESFNEIRDRLSQAVSELIECCALPTSLAAE